MTKNLSITFTQTPIKIGHKDIAIDDAKKLLMSGGVCAIPKKSIKTPNINTCTVVALISDLKNKLFHLAPELETSQNVKEKLSNEIEALQKLPNNRVKALIIGGLDPVAGDIESGKSQRIYCAAAEVAFDDFGLDGMLLCGKRHRASMESVEIKGNNAKISISDFKPKSNKEEDIRNNLYERYASIEEYGDVQLDYLA